MLIQYRVVDSKWSVVGWVVGDYYNNTLKGARPWGGGVKIWYGRVVDSKWLVVGGQRAITVGILWGV